MTRPKLGRYPVSSFGPELMELLIRGSKEEVRVPCESMKQMKFLQMRIQMLRGAMAREKHAQYPLATRARTTVTWNTEKHPSRKGKQFPMDAEDCVLIIRPNDSQFAEILEKAGIKPSQGAADVLNDLPLPESSIDTSLLHAPEPDSETTDVPDLDPYAKFKG